MNKVIGNNISGDGYLTDAVIFHIGQNLNHFHQNLFDGCLIKTKSETIYCGKYAT